MASTESDCACELGGACDVVDEGHVAGCDGFGDVGESAVVCSGVLAEPVEGDVHPGERWLVQDGLVDVDFPVPSLVAEDRGIEAGSLLKHGPAVLVENNPPINRVQTGQDRLA